MPVKINYNIKKGKNTLKKKKAEKREASKKPLRSELLVRVASIPLKSDASLSYQLPIGLARSPPPVASLRINKLKIQIPMYIYVYFCIWNS